MLKKIRISLASLMLIIITVLLCGINYKLSMAFAWAAKIQFLPALMAFDIVVILFLLLLTALFGRIYCSVICPLGVMQDVFGYVGGKVKKNRYSFSPEKKWLRYGVLFFFILCLIVGFAPVTTLLAPYSAYGRIINSLIKPICDLINNALADSAAQNGSYLFSEVEIWTRSVTVPVVSVLTLLILALLALANGRTYCNTVCPVGTALSLVARNAIFKIRFDKSKCRNCSLCEKNCKASAIDFKSGTIDYSRCVVCGDCIEVCHFDALRFCAGGAKASDAPVEPDASRRAFIVGAAVAAGGVAAAQTLSKVDGGMAALTEKEAPERQTPLVPAGAVSVDRFKKHCTACQLCVSSCPNNVLRPSTSPERFMQPEMSYERGWCRPECKRCGDVCPAKAISPINGGDKKDIHIGHAVWIESNCLVTSADVACDCCARHCPQGAITMVKTNDNPQKAVPMVDVSKCTGCGACENLCPVRPFSAIYVEGHEQHVYS